MQNLKIIVFTSLLFVGNCFGSEWDNYNGVFNIAHTNKLSQKKIKILPESTKTGMGLLALAILARAMQEQSIRPIGISLGFALGTAVTYGLARRAQMYIRQKWNSRLLNHDSLVLNFYQNFQLIRMVMLIIMVA